MVYASSAWNSSENMGGDLRRCNFSFLFSPFSYYLSIFTSIYPVAGSSPTTSNWQILQSRDWSDYRQVSWKKSSSFPCVLIGEKRPSLASMIFVG